MEPEKSYHVESIQLLGFKTKYLEWKPNKQKTWPETTYNSLTKVLLSTCVHFLCRARGRGENLLLLLLILLVPLLWLDAGRLVWKQDGFKTCLAQTLQPMGQSNR